MSEVATAKPGQAYVDAVRQSFGAAVQEESWQADNQVTLTVDLNSLPDIVEALYYHHDGWLSTIAANDERKLNGHYALYYILSMEGATKSYVVIRGLVPANRPEFPSVTPRVPATVWGEREARDMFGLQPVGLPDERRLVLPDDWPDDLYPLRKDTMDYRTRPPIAADTETYKFISTAGGGSAEVPLGPLHITSDEPGHFRLFVEGEEIVDADYRLFYIHRGMEKLAETRMGYNEVPFLVDRICGICGFTHSVAYVSSVETALKIQIPERVHFIRTILLEVERLHSHLLNIGLACHFVGFDTGFMQFFRVREKAMTMAELLTGARKTYAMNLVGGVRRDILKAERIRTLELIRELRKEVTALLDILVSTPNMLARTKNVGRLEPQVARDYSPVGPVIRASASASSGSFVSSTTSAPSSSSRSAPRPPRVSAMTRAPRREASATSNVPTEPLAPGTSTQSPADVRPAVSSAWASGPFAAMIAAFANETPSGSGCRFFAGTRVSSA